MMLEVLLPKEDYEVDVLYWAAGCHGRWLGFVFGGGGSVVAAALLSIKWRKLAPSISVEMVRLARPFSSRLSFAA